MRRHPFKTIAANGQPALKRIQARLPAHVSRHVKAALIAKDEEVATDNLYRCAQLSKQIRAFSV